jgi:hypothetical protein
MLEPKGRWHRRPIVAPLETTKQPKLAQYSNERSPPPPPFDQFSASDFGDQHTDFRAHRRSRKAETVNNYRLTAAGQSCPIESTHATFKDDVTIADVLAYVNQYSDEDDVLVAAVRGAAEDIQALWSLLEHDAGSAPIVCGGLRRLEARLNAAVALAKELSLEADDSERASGQFAAGVAS